MREVAPIWRIRVAPNRVNRDVGVYVLQVQAGKQFNLHFINTPIQLSDAIGKEPPLIDKYGLIYVIDEDMAAVKADP